MTAKYELHVRFPEGKYPREALTVGKSVSSLALSADLTQQVSFATAGILNSRGHGDQVQSLLLEI